LCNKLLDYLSQEGDVESMLDKRARQKVKRMERNRRMAGKRDDF